MIASTLLLLLLLLFVLFSRSLAAILVIKIKMDLKKIGEPKLHVQQRYGIVGASISQIRVNKRNESGEKKSNGHTQKEEKKAPEKKNNTSWWTQ